MKKFLSILLVISIVLTFSVLFASCGETKTDDDTTAEVVTDETTAENTEDTTEEETTEEETTAATLEGSVDIMNLVTVTIPEDESWVATSDDESSVTFENSSIGFIANVDVSVNDVFVESHGAEYWANATNENYGGGGTITTETINGITYYHLSGVVDDDTQNLFFADINDQYYLQVNVMYMDLSEGIFILDGITID